MIQTDKFSANWVSGNTLKAVSTLSSILSVASAVLLVSLLLGKSFSYAFVGKFNILLAIQLVGGQIGAFGIHQSCLHHLSTLEPGTPKWVKVAWAALALTCITSSLIFLVLISLITPLDQILKTSISTGIYWVAPATFIFALNKILFALLNSADKIHSLAFAQSARPLTWIVVTFYLTSRNYIEAAHLGFLIFLGELASFLFALTLLRKILLINCQKYLDCSWCLKHLYFAARVFPSHLFIELNSRVDILVLGIYANDTLVGVYSIIAILAEGIFQVGASMRTIVARSLVMAIIEKEFDKVSRQLKNIAKLSLYGTTIIAMLVAIIFLPIVDFFMLSPTLRQSWIELSILLFGVISTAYHSPFWMTLALAGKPAAHTMLMGSMLVLNIGLAFSLIPFFGMLGAACATSITLVIFPFVLRKFLQRFLCITI